MMAGFQPTYFQLLCLLIAALLECKVVTQRPCKQVHQLNINYVQGDNMSISCLTTTHPLESLTVKLQRTNPVQQILHYSDTSPTSEHQRWSVRNDAGNVTLHLKDISLSDQGLYECQVYKNRDCLNATLFNLRVKECKTLDSVHATPDSSVLLPCSELPLQHKAGEVNWKIKYGHKPIDITQFRLPHKPSNNTEKVQKPLYARAIILGNGSLLIRDAVNADASWYQCRVTEQTCYEVNLVMQGEENMYSTSILEALSTTLSSTVATQKPCKQVHELNINYVQGDNMSISCLTTTHPLESLTVKLHRTDPVQQILHYSDTNPASEHQRWSVRNDAGNVTLHLKDIGLSDQGRYECQVYKNLDCLNATLFNLRVKVITDVSTSATSGNIKTGAAVTTNLIAVVIVIIVSPCIFITLIVIVILIFKKGSKSHSKGCNSNNQNELKDWSSVCYSNISGGFDVPFNSLVKHNT